MITTSARLLRVLGLLQAGRTVTAPDLAARLGVEPRTVRRDMDRLRQLGYPVESRQGTGGGYRLGVGGALPPLLLDEEEALAVAVGLRSGMLGSVAGMAEAAERALHKLDAVLPPALRSAMAAIDTGLVTVPAGTSPIDGEDLATILAACDRRVRLRFGYESGRGDTSARDTEPFRLVQAGRRWYLLAWDLERRDWRTFRVDRMSTVRASTFGFEPRVPVEDAATMVSRAISTAPYRFQARVIVMAPVAAVSELVPATVGVVLASTAGESLLLTGSDSLESIALHLVSIGLPMRIVTPPELVHLVGECAVRLSAIHRASGGDAQGPGIPI